MPSRLSSLLVRDGLVGVKRMEKAFQRQVIYGGSLDKILLEMNFVPEERLTQYLALASGLPPAAPAPSPGTPVSVSDPDSARTLPLVPAIPRRPAAPAPPPPIVDQPTMPIDALPPLRPSGRMKPGTIAGHEPNRAIPPPIP